MKEQGPARFVCAGKPGKVLCMGSRAHLLMEETRDLYFGTYGINLEPGKGKMILKVPWKRQ